MLVSPIAVLARQKLQADLKLSVAISVMGSEPMQGVGGYGIEGGLQSQL